MENIYFANQTYKAISLNDFKKKSSMEISSMLNLISN